MALVVPGLLLFGVSIAVPSTVPGLADSVFILGSILILLGLVLRAKHPLTEPLPSMGWPQWGWKLRRKPTRRERILGWVGSVSFAAVGILVLITTGVLSGFGVGAYTLGLFIVFILWLWGHLAGFSIAMETIGASPQTAGVPSQVRARKVPKVK